MTRTVTGSLAALMVMLAACGGKSSGAGTSAGNGLVPGAPVTGSRLRTYFQDDGSTLTRVSQDLAQTGVSALVLEGGTYRESQGTFSPDGGYAIPDVGVGGYLLHLIQPNSAPRYYEQAAHTVDLGTELVGRPSRTFALLPSPITFSLTGLSSWTTADSVTVFSTGGGLASSPTSTVTAIPGSTAADFVLDFKSRPLPAIGDLGWLVQSTQLAAGTPALPYTVVTRTAMLQTLVNMADGDVATLAVPMSAPPTSGMVGMNLRRSEFIAAFPAMAPAATLIPGSFSVAVRAYPHTFSSTVYGPILSFAPPVGTSDADLGTLSYPRPYPLWFTECRTLDYMFQVQIPGALGAPGASFYSVVSRIDLLPGAPSIIAPAIGPARLPLIAGRNALVPQAGVGVTPTLSWSAPTLGTPTRYAVTIYELGSAGIAARASITVTGTSVTIPPLVLVSGSVYFAVINAIAEPNFDFAAPNRLTAPRDQVPFFTAAFAP